MRRWQNLRFSFARPYQQYKKRKFIKPCFWWYPVSSSNANPAYFPVLRNKIGDDFRHIKLFKIQPQNFDTYNSVMSVT